MRRSIVWLFHCLLIITPFVFSPYTSELFEFNKMLVVYVLTSLIAGGWAARMIQEKRIIFTRTWLFWPLLIFLGTQILSTLFSIDPHTSIFGYYSRFHGGLLSTISYLALYFAFVSNVESLEVTPLLRSLVAASLPVALYGIGEKLGVSLSCVIITGQFTDNCWVQDVQTRVFATFGQPNWLAAYLIMLIPLTGWLTLQTWTQRRQPHQWWWLGLWITCLVADIVTVLFTGSRSGFLGLLLSGLILALGGGWLMWKQVEQRRFLLTAGISAALLTGVIFIWCGTPFTPKFSQLWSKYSTHLAAGVASSSALTTGAPTTPTSLPANAAPAANTVLENGGTDSGNIRRIVWKGALAIWRAYPILGSGVETFAYSYYRFRPIEHNMVSEWDFLYNKAHNEFLNTLATTGAIGLLSLLLIMTVTTLILGWPTIQTALHPQTSSADHDLSWWLLPWCLLAGYAALAVSNFFGFSTVMVAVLFYLFPAFWVVYQQKTITSVNKKLIPAAPAHVALLKVSSHTAPTSHSAIKPPAAAAAALETETSAAAWIGYGLVALTVGWCLWSVLGMWDSDRRFANAQALANQSQLPAAYQELTTLVRQAPSEPTYWQEYGLDTAKLAAALQPSDASLAAQLIEPALLGSQRAITLSPANINSWKWRIRTLFYLGQLDSKYLTIATDALLQARRLAPRDPKLALNLALVYQQRQLPTEATQAFVEALQLKPDYELARNSYGPFLEEQGDLAGALEQYRYVVEKLKPGEAFATGRIADLTARLATSSARPR